jgi:Mce-associated membrane protein
MSIDVDADLEIPSAEEQLETTPDPAPVGYRWVRTMAYGVLPALALVMALAAGYLKWCDSVPRESRLAGSEAAHAAGDGAIAMLSYKPDTVEHDLDAARDRLTGGLKDSYTRLTHDVVIPGSRQKKIAAAARVPAAAAITASPGHAVVLVFVDQTITVGTDPPTETASRIRVSVDKVENRWLISGFDPI